MRYIWSSALAVCAISVVGHSGRAFGSEEEHDHEESLFEQAAVYDMEDVGTYSIVVVPGEGETSFDEEKFVFMVLSTSENNEEGLEEAEEAAEEGRPRTDRLIRVRYFGSEDTGGGRYCSISKIYKNSSRTSITSNPQEGTRVKLELCT